MPRWSQAFIDNLLVRIHFIIVMIRWTGLAPWEFEFPFPGSLTSTFLIKDRGRCWLGSRRGARRTGALGGMMPRWSQAISAKGT